MPGPSPDLKARREIVVSSVLLSGALVVLFLASRGAFHAMWYFPHIFGATVVIMAFLSLLTARRVLWKSRLLLAIAILLVAVLTPRVHVRAVALNLKAYQARVTAALRGRPAPLIPFLRSLEFGDGGRGSLNPGGALTLLNFWATWCDPCVEEIPMLEQFWKEHRGSGIEVIGVTRLYDETDAGGETKRVEAFLEGLGVTYPIVIADRDSTAHVEYGVESLPLSVLVDYDGTVISAGAGTRHLMDQAIEGKR